MGFTCEDTLAQEITKKADEIYETGVRRGILETNSGSCSLVERFPEMLGVK